MGRARVMAGMLMALGIWSGVVLPTGSAYQAITQLPIRRQWVSGQVVAVDTRQGLMAVLLEGRPQIATIHRRSFLVERNARIAENGHVITLQYLLGKPVKVEFSTRDGLHRAHSIIVREMPTRG